MNTETKIGERFNTFCAKTMGWHRGTGRLADAYFFLGAGQLFGTYKGQVEDYNPYDDIAEMQPILNILAKKGLFVYPEEALDKGELQAGRDAINFFMPPHDEELDTLPSKTVPEAINTLADAVDAAFRTPPPPITNFAYGLDYPDVNEEQEKFNAQCREIVFGHARAQGGSLMLPQAYDPYYNANETINVFEIVLQYLPPTIKFLVTGRTEHDYPEDIDVFEKMKQLIRLYGTDEYMLPPAVAFNKMCATLVEGYNIYDCNANDLFDPYNKIEHLAPILPIVARRVNEDFTLGALMYDLPREESYNMNLFDNMRHYVQRHGQTLIDILDE